MIALVMVAALAQERVLYDFTVDEGRWPSVAIADAEAAAMLKRFPQPHAGHCQIDDKTPGTLLPTMSRVSGAITRAGAQETALLIDYCPGGHGAPETRRLIVFDDASVTFDQELPLGIPGEAIVLASDVTGDGRAELLLLHDEWVSRPPARHVDHAVLLHLARRKATVLHTWTVVDHCSGSDKPMYTAHLIHVTDGAVPRFRDEARTETCHPPP